MGKTIEAAVAQGLDQLRPVYERIVEAHAEGLRTALPRRADVFRACEPESLGTVALVLALSPKAKEIAPAAITRATYADLVEMASVCVYADARRFADEQGWTSAPRAARRQAAGRRN